MIECIFLDKITSEMQTAMENERPTGVHLSFFSEVPDCEKEKCLQSADAFLTATYKVDKSLMEKAANVKIVQKMGVGIDNIDAVAASSLGIIVKNVPGGNANGVAELTMGLIIDVYRRITSLDKMNRKGEWGMWTYRSSSYEIKGKKHGIIGFGHVGKRVAELSHAFGTELLYYNRTQMNENVEKQYGIKYVSLEGLLQAADIVSIHLPFTVETKDFISKREMDMMKHDAILINVGRGGVVNEKALYEVLLKGKLLGAGIDVWEKEPLQGQNLLLQLDNIVATPHIGGGTVDAAQNILRSCFKNILITCKQDEIETVC